MKEKFKKFIEDHKFKLVFAGAIAGTISAALLIGAIKNSGEPDPIVVNEDILKRIWREGVDYGFGIGVDEDTKLWRSYPEVRSAIKKVVDEYVEKYGTDQIMMDYQASYDGLNKIMEEVLK